MNNRLRVGFYDLDNNSIHNTNNNLLLLSCYDLKFFIANKTLSEFEKYAFGKLIERHVKNDKYKDYNISISECLYIDDNCSLLNKVCEYSQFCYDNRVKNYFTQDNINYNLTKKDIDRLKDLKLFDKLNNEGTTIIAVKINNIIYRKSQSLLWRLFHKRKVDIRDYLDYEF